jgi:virulence factor Mce-like protein
VVKDAPSFGKIAAMVLFALSCFGLLLFLWLAFGGPVPLKPKGYRFHTSFAEAGQLALEADVRISGVPVGKVKTITPDKVTGRADVEIQLRSRYAPLPSDAKAILRQKTLLGETYVELTPGRRAAKPIREGGVLPASQVSDTVELDEILRAFDPKTRAAFQDWMQTQAQAIDGRGRDLNDALGNLGPFAEDTADIVAILNRQEGAVSRLIANTGIVFQALTERDTQLRSLIQNSNTVFATTAARDEALKASFRALPTFEKESTLTFNRLTEFADKTDPLVTQLRPAARELSPTLQDLEAIAPDLKSLLEQLQPLIDASVEGFPAAEKTLEDLRPLVAQLTPATAQLAPAVEFIGLNKRELTSFFANTVAATQAKDPGTTLHYLRTSNPLNAENLAVYPNRLPSNRPNPYRLPGGFNELPNGLPVYEDRQCNAANLVPSITNTPLTLVNDVVGAVPTAVPTVVPDPTGGLVPLPPIGLPPIPQVPLTPEQATALIPNELLQRIQEFAFAGQSNGGAVPAPPCRKQGPFTFGGETTQYPHVNARSGG